MNLGTWVEMAALSVPPPGAEGSGNLITPNTRRNNLPLFKNLDAPAASSLHNWPLRPACVCQRRYGPAS